MSKIIIDCEDGRSGIINIVTEGDCLITQFEFASNVTDNKYHTKQNISIVPSDYIEELKEKDNEMRKV